MMALSSSARMPALASAAVAALTPISELCSPSAERRRSRMPVRLTIHSSVVSTFFIMSALVTTCAGR
jgi:hypothetical protein